MPIRLVNKEKAETLVGIWDAIQEEAKRIGVSVSIDKGNIVSLDWKKEYDKEWYTAKYCNVLLRIDLKNNGKNYQGSIYGYMKWADLTTLSNSFAEAECALMTFIDALKKNINGVSVDDEEEDDA